MNMKEHEHKITENVSNLYHYLTETLNFNKNNFDILPSDNFEKGEIGITFFNSEIDEKHRFSCKIFDTPELIECESFDQFINYLVEYHKNNFPLIRCDSAKTLKLGFICLKNDKNILFRCRLIEIKKYYDKFKEINEKVKLWD